MGATQTQKPKENSNVSISPIAMNLAETVMSNTTGLVMQNAVTTQQGMQTISNTAVSSTCALIISSGGSGGK